MGVTQKERWSIFQDSEITSQWYQSACEQNERTIFCTKRSEHSIIGLNTKDIWGGKKKIHQKSNWWSIVMLPETYQNVAKVYC